MIEGRHVTGLFIFGLATGLGTTGYGFERERVDNADPTTPALFWRDRNIVVRPLYSSSQDLTEEDASGATASAVLSWQRAGDGCSDLVFFDGQEPPGSETNLSGSEKPDGENRVVWREDRWTASSGRALAITTTEFVVNTGEIVDADIDINGVNFRWTVVTANTPEFDEEGMPYHDLQNTLAHEFGHLLGFAHTNVREATMWGDSPNGEISKRSLADDDILAVCTVYPAGQLGPGEPAPEQSACSASGNPKQVTWWLLALVALFITTHRRRDPAPHA